MPKAPVDPGFAEDLVRAYLSVQAAARGGGNDERRQARRTADRIRLHGYRRATTDWIMARLSPERRVSAELQWFWFNHFNVFWRKGLVGAALPDYLDRAVGARMRGRFVDLLRAVVTHPAMLVYLDNQKNRAGHINENLARELLELHTLGVDGGYSQADVETVARVLTGLQLAPLSAPRRPRQFQAQVRTDGRFEFDPRRHDSGQKFVLGEALTGGGFDEIEALLDRLANHPSTAHHIARRLCTYWRGDAMRDVDIERTASAFRESGGDLESTRVACDAGGPGGTGTFKDPMRWTFSAMDLLLQGAVPQNVEPVTAWLSYLGQPLFACQTPNGYGLSGQDWVDGGGLVRRFELALDMVRRLPEMLPGVSTQDLVDDRLTQLRADAPPRLKRALTGAPTREEAMALYLSSPEFMYW